MKNFEEFTRERPVRKYLISNIGMLFYGADDAGRIIVRKFPSNDMVSIYMEIFYSIRAWIDKRKNISEIVDVLIPFEIGLDFVAREHQIYTSTDELLNEENDISLPDEFFFLQQMIKAELGSCGVGRDKIVEHVIQNSLLEPTGKTYFDFSRKKFVLVEPKILPIYIDMWKENDR